MVSCANKLKIVENCKNNVEVTEIKKRPRRRNGRYQQRQHRNILSLHPRVDIGHIYHVFFVVSDY